MNNTKLGVAILLGCGVIIIGIGVVGMINGDSFSDFFKNSTFGFIFLGLGIASYTRKIKKKK